MSNKAIEVIKKHMQQAEKNRNIYSQEQYMTRAIYTAQIAICEAILQDLKEDTLKPISGYDE